MSQLQETASAWPERARGTVRFLLDEMKPRGPLVTPFNVISAAIILLGIVLLVIRFAYGLGAVTNLSQEYPWGLWIGFDVITGVAFAGGAYVLTFLVYILRQDYYRPLVRVTVLNGFLAYVFYAGALLLDLGRPWNVANPIIGNSFGVSSVLFLVAWHFMLYMLAELIEFSPAVAEWLGWRRAHRILESLTLGAVIFGITLSTLHQSGLGALYMMAKDKIHPLWYSEFIPVLFFVSSIFAGLAMVIFEGSISHRVFAKDMDRKHRASHAPLVLSLSRICAGALFVYLFLQVLVFVHGQNWTHLTGGMGAWYLFEIGALVALPCALFTIAARRGSLNLARIASVVTMIGIVVNRLNVSIIAYRWDAVERYFPTWMEIEVTLAILCAEIWVFRWIVRRMPVLRDPPAWATDHQHRVATTREG